MQTTTPQTKPSEGTQSVTVNNDQRLYVIPCNGGFTCLGFDVCQQRGKRLAAEMGSLFDAPIGSIAAYERLKELQEIARLLNQKQGFRATCELHPALIGYEGRRVEVTMYGERVRFQVGRSTGWIPCHLQIHNSRSSGGGAISPDAPISSLRVIR